MINLLIFQKTMELIRKGDKVENATFCPLKAQDELLTQILSSFKWNIEGLNDFHGFVVGRPLW